MKHYKHVLALLALLVFLSSSVFAQEEMTSDEWEAEIARLSQEKADLSAELESLQSSVNSLKEKKNSLQAIEECQKEMYNLVGATPAEVEDYNSKVNALMADISSKKPTKAERQAELDALKASKLSALPAFNDLVHGKLQKMLDAWQEAPTEIMYNVVRGDHLWGIAKKKDHYGNGFAWPKIYNANRDKIKNPDLIYPKQVLTVPNLTEEETAKYQKLKANYKPAPMQ
ncbi:MAG: LysM peptidoglycan-binding domain-containing protein [Ignavibacteriales bacterium]|nr:LysM peptidoglycan-binding domain-containing protein [Ignavibacteriota bacterium]MCB9247310.1 LysM peptidoglycan-binding domain-containing protein [Ignavibacteriales bacterium]